ncbi:MAG: hypothetical protein K8W52_22465 [Deltaproteobacteria bacterium]|nr:hypothetical protein [Deltaproteobacteria bacterium]
MKKSGSDRKLVLCTTVVSRLQETVAPEQLAAVRGGMRLTTKDTIVTKMLTLPGC